MAKLKTEKVKIKNEFEGASLGDARLDERLLETARILNAQPLYCINAAIDDWKTKKATYRFFSNKKSTPEKILQPHFAQTKKRMQDWDYVYSIQDTSFLEFNKHDKMEGLGSIGRYGDDNHIQGLVSHISLAVSCSGLPLGLQSFEIWARPEEGYGKTDDRDGEKESQKWLRHLDRAKEFYSDRSKMILVADRESDFFELFDKIKNEKINAVIRSKHDRYVKGRDLWLTRALEKASSAGKITIDDVETTDNKKRTVVADLKFASVNIEVPGNCQRQYPFGLELHVVEVYEQAPPEGEKPLYWRLLTTIDVTDFENAKEIIKHYKMRWNIESYFKVLKSGCKVEDCRLEKAERVIRYVAVMSVVAWRIYWTVHVNRLLPKGSWSLVLTQVEYYTLWVRINKKDIMEKKIPKRPPPDRPWDVRECVRSIAKLGGFNGRKNDGEPGMTSIWRGWTRLQDMVEVAEALL